MAAYVTKKCPHCKKSISVLQPKGEALYGSPFRRCHHCGGGYIDKSYTEIAVSGIREADKAKVSPLYVLGIIICVGFIVFFLFTNNGRVPSDITFIFWAIVVFLVILIVLAFFDIKDYPKEKAYFEAEKAASEKRLSDIDYAIALKTIGYDVPEKYLKD